MKEIFPRTADDAITGNGWIIDIDFLRRMKKKLDFIGYDTSYGPDAIDTKTVEDLLLTAEKVLGELNDVRNCSSMKKWIKGLLLLIIKRSDAT